jgi:single-strand DNA-binding protein
MSQGAYVTLIGYVAQEPNIRTTKTGKVVTELRVGISPRYRDNATGEWRDAQPSYFSVSCWERLAHHVRASMHKGDPVLVRGRFKTDTYEDKDGRPKTETRITADTVGHDLSRGIANYIRQRTQHPATESSPAGGQAPATPNRDEGLDESLAEGPDEMLDEEAIARFGRDLDEADLARRALAEDREDEDQEGEDQDEEEGDAAETGVPAASF